MWTHQTSIHCWWKCKVTKIASENYLARAIAVKYGHALCSDNFSHRYATKINEHAFTRKHVQSYLYWRRLQEPKPPPCAAIGLMPPQYIHTWWSHTALTMKKLKPHSMRGMIFTNLISNQRSHTRKKKKTYRWFPLRGIKTKQSKNKTKKCHARVSDAKMVVTRGEKWRKRI